jgi:hypothetical protein
MGHPLYNLLGQLEKAKIHYTLSSNRPSAITVLFTLVGERVEADVFEDGHMEVARFLGTEDILGGKELVDDLIRREIR